jgi:predicted transcriptional regulator
MEQKFNAVAAAVQASGGKVTDLAKALGVSHQAVSLWLKDGRIPLSRVVQVSEVTGIPKHVLRPEFAPSGKAAAN